MDAGFAQHAFGAAHLKPGRKPERRAFAIGAGYAHIPPIAVARLLLIARPSPVPPYWRWWMICLGEAREQAANLGFGQTNARVSDAKLHQDEVGPELSTWIDMRTSPVCVNLTLLLA